MLLRASSEKIGVDAKLESTVQGGDANLPHGAELTRFGEAITRGSDNADAAREALLRAVGPDGLVEASAIVGIFNGLVRTADASGIPLDDGTLNSTVGFREELGLNAYGGAVNTQLGKADTGSHTDDPASAFK
jgi:hypothetical protein